MAQTIQELLAIKPSGNSQKTQYVDTVEAYDKWAEVRNYILFPIHRLDPVYYTIHIAFIWPFKH